MPAEPDPWAQAEGRPKAQLRKAVTTWEDLVEQTRILKERIQQAKATNADSPDQWVIDPADIEDWYNQLERVVGKRERSRDFIIDLVADKPRLKDEAIAWGFKAELLDDAGQGGQAQGGGAQGPASGSGTNTGTQGPMSGTSGDAVSDIVTSQGNDPTDSSGGGGGGGTGGQPPSSKAQAADNRLLGDKGKHYVIRRGPNGAYLAVYSFKVAGRTSRYSVQIGKKDLAKYGIKEGEGKLLTKSQVNNIENLGWADEIAPHIRQAGGNLIKSLERYLSNQYGGNPMLKNDEVMSVVIQNSLEDWSPGEFEQQLRNTKWYNTTNGWQRTWDTTMSKKERADVIGSTRQKVINALENTYGFDYLKHIDGGINKINEWVDNIASGKWGTPGEGLEFWAEKQFDKAAKLGNTPAWISKQKQEEADRAYLNRPEDEFERLRNQEIARFGRTVLDKQTRLKWATDITTEARSEGDWEKLMRQTQKQLYPEFDENFSFIEQANPYKGSIERVLGTTVDWDDKMMGHIVGMDADGKRTGEARPLYDFEQYIRDNDPRFWANPQTEERSRAFGQELLSVMGGV